MITIPHYTKVLNLGNPHTENALVGGVTIQEKIDGSQFRFGLNRNKDFMAGTKRTIIHHPDENKMFKFGSDYVFSIQDVIKKNFPIDTYFYAEYLQKPKHNVICYGRVPKNYIILFDVLCSGKWLDRQELEQVATLLGIDIVPQLYQGEIERKRIDKGAGGYKSSAVDFLKRLVEITASILDYPKIEGVVVKNYNQSYMVGDQIYPLFTKYVREEFKEKHDAEWKIKRPKDALEEFFKSFRSEARWQKAIIHLREKGELVDDVKDIGKLIGQIQQDVKHEEMDYIKDYLYKKFISNILRISVRGFPEWYKEKLLEKIK